MTLRIPGYSIKRELGAGGMAAVYLAIQDSLERRIALKVMSPALVADRTFTKRFLREAKTVAALSHPHVVSIYDVGVTDDQLHYFAMEYLPGGDLAERIRRGMTERELVGVLVAIARALGYSHERGYVHRDVKPGNILFDASGHPVLTDFGIARAASQSTRVTNTGVSVGTSHYMSPEQARGKEVDPRSDLYSLGVVAYEALAGTTPYDGEDGFAVAYAHVFDPIPGLPDAVAHWQPFIDRALAKDREDRFASAAELIEALQEMPGADEIINTDPMVARNTPTTPVPVIGRAAPAVGGLDLLRGLPGSRRHRLWRSISRGTDALGHRLLFFLPVRYRGVLAVVVLLAVLGGLLSLADWSRIRLPSRDSGSEPIAEVADPASTPVIEREVVPPTDDPLVAAGFEDEAGEPPAADEPLAADPDALPIDDQQQARIDELLAQAAEHIAADRLAAPPGNNAFELLRDVLAVDQGNPTAIAEMRRIVDRYLVLAGDRSSERRFGDAVTFLNRAEAVAQMLPEEDLPASLDRAREEALAAARRAAIDAAERNDYTQAVSHLEAAMRLAPNDQDLQTLMDSFQQQPPISTRFRDQMSDGSPGPQMVVVELQPYALETAQGLVDVKDHRTIAVSVTEVTVEEFARFAESTRYFDSRRSSCRDRESRWRSSRDRTWRRPGFPQNDDHPVVCVDWRAATAYANWLSTTTGLSYRLPTETEWEYLALATHPAADSVCTRGNIGDLFLKSNDPGRAVQPCEDGWAYTAPTGYYSANALEVKGLVGNVREWTSDCWIDQRVNASTSYAPALEGDCDLRVVKGVSWLQSEDVEAPAQRVGFDSDDAFNTVGFRVVRPID